MTVTETLSDPSYASSTAAPGSRLPAALARGEIPSLDGLRALSIGIVFFAHAGLSKLIPGGFGVTVFFFLSGFLITTLLIREWQRIGTVRVGRFYMRRLLRLSPPLLFSLALAYGLLYAGLVVGEFDGMAMLSEVFYFHNYYLVAYPQSGSVVSGLTPLWSLSVEEHFYMIFPLIFLLYTRGTISARHLIALLGVIVLWRYVRFDLLLSTEWSIYISTDTRFDSILYGCLLAILQIDGRAGRILPPRGPVMALALFVALGVLAASLLIRDLTFQATLRYTFQGLALMVVFHYAVTRADHWAFRPLNLWAIKRIGLYSYTIYLAHYVIIRMFEKNRWFTDSYPVFLVAVAAVTIAYAAFVYHLVEAPARHLKKRYD